MDYAATTPMDSGVEKAMRPFYSGIFGNPSSSHLHGQEASRAVFLARQGIAKALNADYTEIIFTGSATEANNLALRGAFEYILGKHPLFSPAEKRDSLSARHSALKSGDRAGAPPRCSLEHASNAPLRVIISAIEHESVYETCMRLKNRYGAEIIEVPVNDEGIIDLRALEAALNENTVLVSVQMANSELGVIQPIKEISKIVRNFRDSGLKIQDSGIRNGKSISPYPLFHVDAVQAFQYFKCDVTDLGIDLLTLSAHKIYGPKGVGLLYVRRLMNPESCILNPLVVGGGQENGMRSGTENVAAIVGFAKAVEIAEKLRVKESKRIAALRNALWKGIKKIIPDAELNGSASNRLPNNISVYLPSRPAQDVCIELDLMGIAVSPGTAC
ncbi:MAG: cysteine desulfurase family protein, partial [bacterium]|nr:cysteine desulfurase family protein [bacterium]